MAIDDDIAADLELSYKGKQARAKLRDKLANAPPIQSLSTDDGWTIPHTYRNHYEWLKLNRPNEAQAYWDDHKYDPSRVITYVEHKLIVNANIDRILDMLDRVGQPNTLKRRI